ncbi:MAG TPA: cytochrome c [Thermoanaerobaculia bacterium]|jgi:cytochrome c oxidase subunit 2|nr:cytochrome c [Thermoanaerobaculia bacterium]
MKVPIVLKIAAVAVLATGFYTYVGQLVPQKEVQPPEETKMSATMTTADLVNTGKTIVEGKGSCLTCHTIGKTSGPFRFPDLAGVGARAATRIPGFNDVQYLADTLYHPNDFIVPGFSPGMPTINKPPIGLTDDEIRAVISYLQSLGGTPTVTMQTTIPYAGGAAAPAAETAAAGAPAAGAAPAGAAPAAEAAGAGATAATTTAAAASPSAPRAADALVAQYNCATCHRAAAPSPAARFADLAGKREPDLLAGLAAHPSTPSHFEAAISLVEARSLARYVAAQKGGGA